MYYTNTIEVNVPIDQFFELFQDPDNLKHWLPGIRSKENIRGMPGQFGSKAILVFEKGRRQIEVIETVTERNFPYIYSVTHKTPNTFNEIDFQFENVGGVRMIWGVTNIFKVSGYLQYLSWFKPRYFQKNNLALMMNFKAFAEEGKSILTETNGHKKTPNYVEVF